MEKLILKYAFIFKSNFDDPALKHINMTASQKLFTMNVYFFLMEVFLPIPCLTYS